MLDIGDIIFGMPESYENGEVMKFKFKQRIYL